MHNVRAEHLVTGWGGRGVVIWIEGIKESFLKEVNFC